VFDKLSYEYSLFMPSLAISCRKYSVCPVRPSVRDHVLKDLWTRCLTNWLWEFHQIYNWG